MAKQLTEITPDLKEFILSQKVFFVATAAAKGRINLSPKGMDTFRVLGPNKIVWLNLTGSGNETAAHLLKNNRMTIMFCSFEGKPSILRLYGTAKAFHERDEAFKEHMEKFPKLPGTRQFIEMKVEMVQTSCGYAVPFMDFKEERSQLNSWAEKQGKKRLENYKKEKNAFSIDGFETKIFED